MPICRNKRYLKLVKECELVSSYLCRPCHSSRERDYPLRVLHNLLKPENWRIDKDSTTSTLMVRGIGDYGYE